MKVLSALLMLATLGLCSSLLLSRSKAAFGENASLEQKLDPEKFLRIHRSRIVRTGAIVELRGIDNREYVVKLTDGSEHRSSRTYASTLENWLNSGKK